MSFFHFFFFWRFLFFAIAVQPGHPIRSLLLGVENDKIMSFFRFFFFWRFLFFAIAVQSKFLSAQEACWSQKSRGQHGGGQPKLRKLSHNLSQSLRAYLSQKLEKKTILCLSWKKITPKFEPRFESLFEPKVEKKKAILCLSWKIITHL